MTTNESRSVRPRNKKLNAVELNDVKPKITSIRLLRTSLLYQTKEFFNNSTLHGVRYIAESNRPFGERLMWFCFTVIGLISALVIIVSLWEKFQTNPTITGKLKHLRKRKTHNKVADKWKCTISPFLSGTKRQS